MQAHNRGRPTARVAAVLAATALAATTGLAGSGTALADDLEQTSEEAVAEIQAQDWPEFSKGDSAIDIRAVKMLLSYIEINPGEINNEFDEDLEAALISYQEAFDLEGNGELNEETWEDLRDRIFGQAVFGPGSTGPVVEMIQRVLNAKYNYHLATDGVYGYWTEAAVREVQDQFDIGVDGIFGPLSFEALITYQDFDR
ncbi:peptidoglycan-binding domain-containing protein [Nocardiopsis nanhaiensis]